MKCQKWKTARPSSASCTSQSSNQGHVLLLNTAVMPGDDEKKLWQLLTDTLNTLKPSDKPLSLKAASETLKGS